METVIINTKSNANAKLIIELAKKMGDTGKKLKFNELEDYLLGNIMKEVDKTLTINTNDFLEKLQHRIKE